MRIAIVNDVSLAREVLRRLVLTVPSHTVAWTAEDGAEAVRKTAADRPDAILMDLVMPCMNGVEATRQIMRSTPCPVLVVTATVSGHYDLVMQAMGAGALDAVETPVMGPGGTLQKGERLLARLSKLQAALNGVPGSGVVVPQKVGSFAGDLPPLVLIGSSTGGPGALPAVLGSLPANFPAAILVAQHIGAEFVPGLVQQISAHSALQVRAATVGDRPTAGTVLVAASDDHLEVAPDYTLRYTAEPRTCPYRPSADVLFTTAGACWPRLGVGVLLTGMGTDGAEGLLRLRTLGWHTIAQDESTCVVYGMPKVAVEKRAVVEVIPLHQIGPALAARILGAPRN